MSLQLARSAEGAQVLGVGLNPADAGEAWVQGGHWAELAP